MAIEQDKIDKGNRLIVKYMGYNADEEAVVVNMHGYAYDQLKFHESLDWLKPVIDKICEEILSTNTYPRTPLEQHARKIVDLPVRLHINTIWFAVLNYITWLDTDEAKRFAAIADECRMHYTKE
jgi:hypothetical protein